MGQTRAMRRVRWEETERAAATRSVRSLRTWLFLGQKAIS